MKLWGVTIPAVAINTLFRVLKCIYIVGIFTAFLLIKAYLCYRRISCNPRSSGVLEELTQWSLLSTCRSRKHRPGWSGRGWGSPEQPQSSICTKRVGISWISTLLQEGKQSKSAIINCLKLVTLKIVYWIFSYTFYAPHCWWFGVDYVNMLI